MQQPSTSSEVLNHLSATKQNACQDALHDPKSGLDSEKVTVVLGQLDSRLKLYAHACKMQANSSPKHFPEVPYEAMKTINATKDVATH